eukprot:974418-Pleurochrysis_carterae.AAC.1
MKNSARSRTVRARRVAVWARCVAVWARCVAVWARCVAVLERACLKGHVDKPRALVVPDVSAHLQHQERNGPRCAI